MCSQLGLVQKALSVVILGVALSSMISQAGELSLSATPMAAVHCESGAKTVVREAQPDNKGPGTVEKLR